MLGTIVLEKYKKKQQEEIANALEKLIYDNPTDWSTAGIYCYWNYQTKEILYIGLAVNLIERFKQHNDLIECSASSCKKDKIKDYFDENEYLGFTIMLQSALSQPINHREKKKYSNSFEEEELSKILGNEGRKSIQKMEGLLIESFKLNFGRFPIWNQVGGSLVGQKAAKQSHIEILKLLVSERPNKYVALASLTELSTNQEYCFYEAYLHGIRISPLPTQKAIDYNKRISGLDIYTEIRNKGYFGKELKL